MKRSINQQFGLLGIVVLASAALASCVATPAPVISRYANQPIVARIESKYIDDDTPAEYTVLFRNTGGRIVSFDYTIADQPGVPHIDREGPNSGFVGNHYPGAEVAVRNPLKTQRVWITLGTISYGKKVNLPRPGRSQEVSSGPGSNAPAPVEPPVLPEP